MLQFVLPHDAADLSPEARRALADLRAAQSARIAARDLYEAEVACVRMAQDDAADARAALARAREREDAAEAAFLALVDGRP